LGDLEAAWRHLDDALAMNERMGARPWVARTKLDLARTLIARGGPGDDQRARTLADESQAIADEIGMPVVATRARGLIDT
jgi:hypothetical protein